MLFQVYVYSSSFCLSIKVEHPKLFRLVALFVNEVSQRWLLFKVYTINVVIAQGIYYTINAIIIWQCLFCC